MTTYPLKTVKLEELTEIIDCGGSGTLMRTIIPFLAITETDNKAITVIGDRSLSNRPIGEGLYSWMDGFLFVDNDGKLPFTILPKIQITGDTEEAEIKAKVLKNAILSNLKVINDEVKRQQLKDWAKDAT